MTSATTASGVVTRNTDAHVDLARTAPADERAESPRSRRQGRRTSSIDYMRTRP